MEIIVKAKQANNPMFQFLHFDSALHPFYRHVQAAIRNGTYVIPDEDDAAESAEKDPPENVNDNTNGQSNESDSENDNYLHPSLQPKVPVIIINSLCKCRAMWFYLFIITNLIFGFRMNLLHQHLKQRRPHRCFHLLIFAHC